MEAENIFENEFEVNILARTEKAILVEKPCFDEGYDDELVGKTHHTVKRWIPLSLVKIVSVGTKTIGFKIIIPKRYTQKIIMPNWLAVKYYWAEKELKSYKSDCGSRFMDEGFLANWDFN